MAEQEASRAPLAFGHVATALLCSVTLGCAPHPAARHTRTPQPADRSETSAPKPEPDAPPSFANPATVEQPAPEPPGEEVARFVPLAVPGFLDAVVSLPGGAVKPEPVLLATHGAGGAPEHHCEAWRSLLGPRGVVVCPRGKMINRIQGPDAGFYYPNHQELKNEVLAAVDAVRSQLPERIDPGAMVYAGYSQGATMGALMLPELGQVFPRLVLVEGGFSEWNLDAARRFVSRGGARVLFVCGLRTCKRGADRSRQALERAEVRVETRLAGGAGHTYLGPVAREIGEGFAWLVQGDARWE